MSRRQKEVSSRHNHTNRMRLLAFDLDDTLYKERDYAVSGHNAVCSLLADKYGLDFQLLSDAMNRKDVNPFDSLMERIDAAGSAIDESIAELVEVYRYHAPKISLPEETEATLEYIKDKCRLALITDGRIITQTNKIAALGLDRFFSAENIFISEQTGHDKLHPHSFEALMSRFGDMDGYVYVGDNPAKDFLWPNRLGWLSVMLNDADKVNIHPQCVEKYDAEYRPALTINAIKELPKAIRL